MLHISERLAQAGIAPGLAIELAEQALGLAEVATETDGSVRDYPNYDRNGRLQIFRGRCLDAKGWALFKSSKPEEAAATLNESLQAYGSLPERKRALLHLASVRESAGDLNEALELHLTAYEPSENANLDVNRAVIESLYRKIHGSLDGLDKRLGLPAASADVAAATASLKPAPGKPEAKAGARTARRPGPLKPSLPSAPAPEPAPARTEEPAPPPPTEARTEQRTEEPRPEPATVLPATPATTEVAPVLRDAPATPVTEAPAAEPDAPPPPPPAEVRLVPVSLPVIEMADILPRPPLSLPTWIWVASVLKGQPARFETDADELPAPPAPRVHTRKRRVDVPSTP
jgi:hypothetical protein